MALSSHFVIYSQSVQVRDLIIEFQIRVKVFQGLLECYQFLKKRGGSIHVEIADSWLREYQVRRRKGHFIAH